MALGSYASSQLNVLGERSSSPSMFDFQPKQPTEDKNISSDEAKQLFTGKPPQERKMIYEKLKSNWYSFEDEAKQSTQQVTTQPAPQEMGMASSVGQLGKNLSAGIASGASQAVGGTLGILGDFLSAPFSKDVSLGGIFTGKNTGWLGQLARDETARQQASGAQAFGANTESMWYKGGKFGTGLGLSVATPGGVLGMAGKGAGLATRAGLGAVQGGIETGKFLGLTEGRLGTGGELATGAAFGAAIPVLGAGLGKAKDYITTKLPKSLIATGISTPTEYVKTSERLNKLWIEEFQDATSTGKWLLQNKIAGDLEKRTAQLNALAEKSKQTTKNLLKSYKAPVSDDVIWQMKSWLEGLREKLAAAKLTKYTNMIDDWANKQVWGAEDLNSARTFLADKGKIFKQSGDWVDDLQKENLQDIWLSASQYLDNAIPWFRAGNKDYEVASALAEAIKLKTGQDQVRQVFNLVNVASAGVGGAIGWLTGNDPMSALQNAAIGAGLGLTGRAIFSPSNMSKLAVKLSEYAPKAEATKATKAIELFVKSRGENPLPQSVMNLISKANKTLWNPFKDISFIKKLGSGQVKGLSKEALNAMKWVKTVGDALKKAKSAGVEDEIRKAYFGSPKFGGKPPIK